MDGVQGRKISLTLTDFVGEYNGKPGACPMGPEIVPVYSEDGEHWRSVPSVTWDDQAKEATIELPPERTPSGSPTSRLTPPRGWPDCWSRWNDAMTPGSRSSARPCRGGTSHLVTVTDADVPDAEKATVWLQARQHAWESGTSFVMEGALRFVTSDEPHARPSKAGRLQVHADGRPRRLPGGQVRFNANGYDVNRHWDEVDLRQKRFLTLMPEIWYVKKAIRSHVDAGHKIDLLLNLHNTETGRIP